MPRVGCEAKLTQTTGWCLKTRSAPMITQQARVPDPLMGECLLLAGNSATGTVKAAFLQLFYFTAFRNLYHCM